MHLVAVTWLFVSNQKCLFCANLDQKIKIVSLQRWNLVPRLTWISGIQWWYSLFLFSTKNNLFWVNLVQKIEIVSLSWNLVHRIIRICKIQWWCCPIFLFSTRNSFLGIFGPENQNCQFKVKFDTYITLNMHNSMVMFTFSVVDWECPFWASLVQKIKIVSLSWNLVPKLIEICRI